MIVNIGDNIVVFIFYIIAIVLSRRIIFGELKCLSDEGKGRSLAIKQSAPQILCKLSK